MATPPQLKQPLEEQMLTALEGSVPQSMDPGTVFVLEGEWRLGDEKNPYVAAMSCPRCGQIGLITLLQLYCRDWMICGGEKCSAEWRIINHLLNATVIDIRAPQ